MIFYLFKMPRFRWKRSLLALLGVIVVAAILLPAVRTLREISERNQSVSNLKMINMAILNYEDIHKHLPARAIFDKQGKPLLSWRVLILPQIEEGELYKQFHLDEPWDSEHNKPLINKMPGIYEHPKFDQQGKTLYQAVVGKGFAFEGTEGAQLASFNDTSRKIWVVEVLPAKAVTWTKPEDWTPDENDVFKDLDGLWAGDGFEGRFGDGFMAGFADGHVDWFSTKTTNPTTFKAMLTRNVGERLPP